MGLSKCLAKWVIKCMDGWFLFNTINILCSACAFPSLVMHCELFKVRKSPALIRAIWSGCVVSVLKWEYASVALDQYADSLINRKTVAPWDCILPYRSLTPFLSNGAHPATEE